MKRFFENISGNTIKALIKFEVLFKLLLGMILLPCATFAFELTMKTAGYHYLTTENIASFLTNPLCITFLFIVIMLLAILTLFDVTTIVVIVDIANQGKKVSLREVVNYSFEKFKKQVVPHNFLIALLLLLWIPFLNLGIVSNVITSLRVPEIILKYIHNHTTLVIIYTVVYFACIVLLLPWLYASHYMVLEEKTLKESLKLSKNLSKKNHFKDMIKVILVQIVFAIVYVVMLSIAIVLIWIIGRLFAKLKILESVLLTGIVTILVISTIISNAVTYTMISNLFYCHKKENEEAIQHIQLDETSTKPKRNERTLGIVLVLIAFLGGCTQMYLFLMGRTNFNVESLKRVEVTAHRGASKEYPENTMLAFQGALDYGADWIELDVQQTKDRQLVISHDTSLLRTAGINREINDMTYEELQTIDVGSFLNADFANTRIPLLSEIIHFAKENNVRLNIELKPTGKEIDFEQQVIDLIKQNEFENQCVVTSQVYQTLENIKKIDASIKTVYVMTIAVGDITKLEAADAFSVESINATKKLIKNVHQSQKELLVWTVNSEENIQKMIELGVDNIITDDVRKCKALIAENRNSSYTKMLIKRIK